MNSINHPGERAHFQLPFGSQRVELSLPGENLLGYLAPNPVPAYLDPLAAVEQALDQPLDTSRAEELVHPGETVTILIDDYTRATPAALILPCLLKRLLTAGIAESDVTLLVATGTHRPSNEAELRQKLGKELFQRLRVVQHDCTDESSQVYLGVTSHGTPVWVNRFVVESDRLFGIGHVDPSDYAGYSGGWKLVVPGTAALETVNANHALAVLSFRQYGTVDLLTRLDINEAGAMVPADLFINTVINQEGKLAGVYAGSPDAIHQAGVGLARQVYEVDCLKPADLCVASAYPYDVDFYQAIRAIEYADLIVRPGGSILVTSPCPDGIGSQAFYELLTCAERTPEDYLRRIARREGKVTYNVLGYYLSRILGEKHVLAFMPGIPADQLTEIGIHPLDSLQTGVDSILHTQPHAAVAVMPVGSATIPHLCPHADLE